MCLYAHRYFCLGPPSDFFTALVFCCYSITTFFSSSSARFLNLAISSCRSFSCCERRLDICFCWKDPSISCSDFSLACSSVCWRTWASFSLICAWTAAAEHAVSTQRKWPTDKRFIRRCFHGWHIICSPTITTTTTSHVCNTPHSSSFSPATKVTCLRK